MIIYDILLILQYQVSSTVMDLIVVFCIVSFFVFMLANTLEPQSQDSWKQHEVLQVCVLRLFFTGPFAVHDIRLPVRRSVRHTSMLCRNAWTYRKFCRTNDYFDMNSKLKWRVIIQAKELLIAIYSHCGEKSSNISESVQRWTYGYYGPLMNE